MQVFPKLEELRFILCSKLTRMPDNCFLALKKSRINYSDMILEPMSIKVSSLTDLGIKSGHISEGGRGSSSTNIAPMIEEFLKNNCQSLTNLKLCNWQGLTGVTVGVTLEELIVSDCPDLTSISIIEETCLRTLEISEFPSLSEFAQSVICTITSLCIDEIPSTFSSSVNFFPNLNDLLLRDGVGKVKSTLESDNRLVSVFSTLTSLYITDFQELKTLPDTLVKLPSLESLYILDCKNLESLPTFDQSHNIQYLISRGYDTLEERYKKETGPEWYKILHIPYVLLNYQKPYMGRES